MSFSDRLYMQIDKAKADLNYSLPLQTLRELSMQHIMNALTDKPGWETKVCSVSSKSYLEAIPWCVVNDVCLPRRLSHDRLQSLVVAGVFSIR